MVKIPTGSFLMGSNENDNEKPIHRVTLHDFYLGKYAVTQEQWKSVMGNNPSRFNNNSKNPVDNVCWDDCKQFCQKLSKLTGKKYRLPTEAEWEYACRAGSPTRYSFGDDAAQLIDYAWYWDNSYVGTHPVGQKKPNYWGLYDMHGNVWEWCEDDCHDNYGGAPADGRPWTDNHHNNRSKILRGGSWYGSAPQGCRSATRSYYYRDYTNSYYGFRLALG
jgi:formylglycine-generating enzyme required for sulfatase activity